MAVDRRGRPPARRVGPASAAERDGQLPVGGETPAVDANGAFLGY
ncbi:hypothetical protein [Haloterrigena gelatinilytica]|nr:hypothetical protein [Haloterrigena gelatinilytica]